MIASILNHLDQVRAQYDGVFCDIWGVVHNGRSKYASACEALQRYRQSGGVCILVSNVPKPSSAILGQLDRLSVPRDCWDAIVTSGDATRALLSARAPGPMARIGPVQDASLWQGLGLIETGLDEAVFLLVTGPSHWEDLPEAYRPYLEHAKRRGLEMICANPDIQVREGDRLLYCGGALARLYQNLGGQVLMAGKPHPPIYALARARLEQIMGPRRFSGARVLTIGDGIETDLLGAAQEGLDALFIAGGMHGGRFAGQDLDQDLDQDLGDYQGTLDQAAISAALTSAGVQARYAMRQLK